MTDRQNQGRHRNIFSRKSGVIVVVRYCRGLATTPASPRNVERRSNGLTRAHQRNSIDLSDASNAKFVRYPKGSNEKGDVVSVCRTTQKRHSKVARRVHVLVVPELSSSASNARLGLCLSRGRRRQTQPVWGWRYTRS